jgi:hypothetical protein
MASLGAPVSLSLGRFLSDKIAPQILITATGFLVLFLVILVLSSSKLRRVKKSF